MSMPSIVQTASTIDCTDKNGMNRIPFKAHLSSPPCPGIASADRTQVVQQSIFRRLVVFFHLVTTPQAADAPNSPAIATRTRDFAVMRMSPTASLGQERLSRWYWAGYGERKQRMNERVLMEILSPVTAIGRGTEKDLAGGMVRMASWFLWEVPWPLAVKATISGMPTTRSDIFRLFQKRRLMLVFTARKRNQAKASLTQWLSGGPARRRLFR